MNKKDIVKFIVSKFSSLTQYKKTMENKQTANELKDGLNLVPIEELVTQMVPTEGDPLDKEKAVLLFTSEGAVDKYGRSAAHGHGVSDGSWPLLDDWTKYKNLVIITNWDWNQGADRGYNIINVSWLKYLMKKSAGGDVNGRLRLINVYGNFYVFSIYDDRNDTTERMLQIDTNDSRWLYEIWGIK